MAKSELVSGRPARWTIPRWVFEGWLWLNAPISILSFYGCPWKGRDALCERVGNSVGELFGLFPMSLQFLVAAFIGSDVIVWTCLVLATAGCHLFLRRYAPERLGLLTAALFVVGWYALSYATEFVGLIVYFQLHLPGAVFRSSH